MFPGLGAFQLLGHATITSWRGFHEVFPVLRQSESQCSHHGCSIHQHVYHLVVGPQRFQCLSTYQSYSSWIWRILWPCVGVWDAFCTYVCGKLLLGLGSINHSVLAKDRFFTANSAFSTFHSLSLLFKILDTSTPSYLSNRFHRLSHFHNLGTRSQYCSVLSKLFLHTTPHFTLHLSQFLLLKLGILSLSLTEIAENYLN